MNEDEVVGEIETDKVILLVEVLIRIEFISFIFSQFIERKFTLIFCKVMSYEAVVQVTVPSILKGARTIHFNFHSIFSWAVRSHLTNASCLIQFL